MGRSKWAEGRERLRQEVFLFHDLLLPASHSRSAQAGAEQCPHRHPLLALLANSPARRRVCGHTNIHFMETVPKNMFLNLKQKAQMLICK